MNGHEMPDNIEQAVRAVAHWYDTIIAATLFAAAGMAIEIGQYLREMPPRPPLSVAIGRALTTGGLAVGAGGAVLALIPDLPQLGQIGVASAAASMGMTGIELLLRRVFAAR